MPEKSIEIAKKKNIINCIKMQFSLWCVTPNIWHTQYAWCQCLWLIDEYSLNKTLFSGWKIIIWFFRYNFIILIMKLTVDCCFDFDFCLCFYLFFVLSLLLCFCLQLFWPPYLLFAVVREAYNAFRSMFAHEKCRRDWNWIFILFRWYHIKFWNWTLDEFDGMCLLLFTFWFFFFFDPRKTKQKSMQIDIFRELKFSNGRKCFTFLMLYFWCDFWIALFSGDLWLFLTIFFSFLSSLWRCAVCCALEWDRMTRIQSMTPCLEFVCRG